MTSSHVRRITVPATLENLEALTGMVAEFLREHGFPEQSIFETDLAVDEACTNVIRYAYAPEEGEVTVVCTVTSGGATVCITDSGRPFNPLDVAAPDLSGSIEDRPIGGLGVHLIRSLMDEVTYEYVEGKNILCMTRYRGDGSPRSNSDHL